MKTLKNTLTIILIAFISLNVLAQEKSIKYYDNGNLKQEGFYDENGKGTGEWKFYHESGKIDAKVIFLNGFFNGLHEKYDKEGVLEYTQDYVKGERVGPKKGYYEDKTLMYVGHITNKKANGEWKYYHSNGKLLKIGNYLNEKKTGKWKFYGFSGQIEDEGNYVDDKKTGEWKFYVGGVHRDTRNYLKGKIVENVTKKATTVLKKTTPVDNQLGCISGDCENGWGTFVWAGGNKYEGTWESGQHHGPGNFYINNGDTYFGDWQSGVMHGIATYKWNTGSIYSGEYKNGNMHGKGKRYDNDGNLFRKGNWINDEYQVSETGCLSGDCENGKGTFLWENGQKYEGEWKGGKLNGTGVLYLEDGTIFHQGQWENHEKVD